MKLPLEPKFKTQNTARGYKARQLRSPRSSSTQPSWARLWSLSLVRPRWRAFRSRSFILGFELRFLFRNLIIPSPLRLWTLWILLCLSLFLSLTLAPAPSALAGIMELSGNFSFSSNSYGDGNIQWTRRWSASLGYHFWALSEIEVSFQDVLYRTKIGDVEDTTFHDQIYSVNWVQSLAPKGSLFQPYFKVGAGQLNREATGSYAGGITPPAIYDSWTAIAGLGLRIFIFNTFALRAEGTSYLTAGDVSTWKNNFSINGGFSLYF